MYQQFQDKNYIQEIKELIIKTKIPITGENNNIFEAFFITPK